MKFPDSQSELLTRILGYQTRGNQLANCINRKLSLVTPLTAIIRINNARQKKLSALLR